MEQIVVFTLDQQVYGLPLNKVVRVIHAIEITRLPKTPEIVTGIVNVNGRILPVIDVRKRFGLATHEIDIDDQLILADTGKRQVALMVDSVTGVQAIESYQHINAKETMPFAAFIGGIVKMDTELILIYDLEQFLNLDEEKQLEEALSKRNT